MNLKDFSSALSDSLEERGIPRDIAQAHISRLIPTLSEEDITEIESFSSAEDFKDISDYTADMLRRSMKPTVSSDKNPAEAEDDESAGSRGYRETPEGRQRFITITACASPLFVLGFILYFALWGIAFGAEIAMIVLGIAALIGVAALGAASSIGGIIYGIVTHGSIRSVGVYEIGFGIVIAGVTFLAGILIFNFALRFMPFAIKKTAAFFPYCQGRVRELLEEYRRRCFTK